MGLFGVSGLLPHERDHEAPEGGDRPPRRRGARNLVRGSENAHYFAHQRHLDESHVTAIHGHIASTDRRNQGKRDHRGDE